VTWTNRDSVAHTATRGTAFDSGLIEQGESYSLTFVRAGTYRYVCTPHPNMTGTVVVRAASGGPQPPNTDTVAVAESGMDAPAATTPGTVALIALLVMIATSVTGRRFRAPRGERNES
jgi:hypothetical protein